jgi:hypothetical protein
MSDTVHWDRVAAGLQRDHHRMIWRPYGLPEITDPEHSVFHDGEIQPSWDVSQKIVVQSRLLPLQRLADGPAPVLAVVGSDIVPVCAATCLLA